MHSVFVSGGQAAIPIWFVTTATYPDVRERLDARARAFADAAGFEPKAGRHLLLPGKDGLSGVLFGIDTPDKERARPLPAGPAAGAAAGRHLPLRQRAGEDARLGALAFALGAYRFTRYRTGDDKAVKLVLPQGNDGGDALRASPTA